MRRAIITGATGGIGIFLILYLIERNVSVVAICRPGSKRINNIPKHGLVEVIECDLKNLLSLKGKLGEADVFYHLAWDGIYGNLRNDMDVQIDNLRGCMDAVDLAAAGGVKKFVGIGSTNEFGDLREIMRPESPCNPNNGYGITKYAAGKMAAIKCQKNKMGFNWCRIGSAYGPFTSDHTLVTGSLIKMLDHERVKFTEGEQIWSFIYNKDVAKALYLIGENGRDSATYIVAGNETAFLREFILKMRDAVDPALEIGLGEIPHYENQTLRIEADIEDLVRDTGYEPDYTFEEGIKETIEWIERSKKSMIT